MVAKVILVLAASLAGGAVLTHATGRAIFVRVERAMSVLQAIMFVLAAASGTAVVLTREPRRQAIAIAFNGIVLALLFLALQAPDVILAQIAIGAALPLMVFVTMLGPAFALMGIAVALGWLPRLTSAVIEQAAWFASGHEFAARLLDGAAWAPAPASSAPELPAPVPGLIAALAAILIAAAALHPDTTAGRVIRRLQGTCLLRRLQDLHSGHVGDYTAWLVLGAAAIGACLACFGTAS